MSEQVEPVSKRTHDGNRTDAESNSSGSEDQQQLAAHKDDAARRERARLNAAENRKRRKREFAELRDRVMMLEQQNLGLIQELRTARQRLSATTQTKTPVLPSVPSYISVLPGRNEPQATLLTPSERDPLNASAGSGRAVRVLEGASSQVREPALRRYVMLPAEDRPMDRQPGGLQTLGTTFADQPASGGLPSARPGHVAELGTPAARPGVGTLGDAAAMHGAVRERLSSAGSLAQRQSAEHLLPGALQLVGQQQGSHPGVKERPKYYIIKRQALASAESPGLALGRSATPVHRVLAPARLAEEGEISRASLLGPGPTAWPYHASSSGNLHSQVLALGQQEVLHKRLVHVGHPVYSAVDGMQFPDTADLSCNFRQINPAELPLQRNHTALAPYVHAAPQNLPGVYSPLPAGNTTGFECKQQNPVSVADMDMGHNAEHVFAEPFHSSKQTPSQLPSLPDSAFVPGDVDGPEALSAPWDDAHLGLEGPSSYMQLLGADAFGGPLHDGTEAGVALQHEL